ncbi:hypothetical protein COV49_02350 [Candidatus Falkowbacteria bacterium CG11_big_fil_rev_8_21_14_0_20_39_10]|uniref:Uncharacterized protein n=1 Tax=Candidatus Falkowbacteria bacterium CG11_big_fil_rev_8_21_14_0_20_39_10 TaxID=1974570 RepID=A0A2M6K983_9BACT|nr:MAG: hypothetical protein COV49_02350 [Candidatus Falkowbacteria bacterium CG11_big_fil_rev_8_21_14_0_20_39_10]
MERPRTEEAIRSLIASCVGISIIIYGYITDNASILKSSDFWENIIIVLLLMYFGIMSASNIYSITKNTKTNKEQS